MKDHELLLDISFNCTFREQARKANAQTPFAKREAFTQQNILADLKEIGRSRNLSLIIEAEKFLVQDDLDKYSNSKEMKASLTAAVKGLEAIEKGIGLLRNPEAYRVGNENFDHPDMRDKEGLPLDAGRKSFRSHNVRLADYLKARSDDIEKVILRTRKENMTIAKALYVEAQRKVLGMPIPEKKVECGEHN